MGTHPIFESDFDCLTDWVGDRIDLEKKRADMADLDDALVSYLSDKYNGDGNGDNDNDAIMNEIDDLPDSASMAGSDKSSGSSDSDSGSSSDADTVVDDRKATDEKDRLRRKKRREE